jgi:hypothetical protein
MKTIGVILLLLAALAGGAILWLREPIEQTTTAALRAYPPYAMVRTRNDTLLGVAHAGGDGSNLLIHRDRLAGPRDRAVTTPNNDTLYSWAFLDLAGGPVTLALPALPERYHSAAIMDMATDNVAIFGTRDGGAGGCVTLEFADGASGRVPPGPGDSCARVRLGTPQGWLLIRVLVDGEWDLPAARAAQQGFTLTVPEASRRPAREAVVLPVLPDPAMLLRRANPVIAESPPLKRPDLAATGFGGDPEAFDALPAWRQWLWRLLLPRLFARLKDGIAQGSTQTGDGWSRSPPGIGTAAADDRIRAGVALGGLAALPVSEAVYWTATEDRDGQPLDGARRYRLTIPADVPARAFWSVSMYERLPDGRLFYVENPIRRYAIGSRTPGLELEEDASLTLTLAADEPGEGANWLPTPRAGPFALVFRAYLPEAAIQEGSWRLPAVERLP